MKEHNITQLLVQLNRQLSWEKKQIELMKLCFLLDKASANFHSGARAIRIYRET